ncbi:hypothetical protein EZV62_011976 [Acer yangbiense]|uniref:Expansin-like EG45 domain-containing protein n=1 Tax=Acer yangbiense TaxID=1000413 RepID=A0A5C7I8P2_9ROSI|nr:hypothetical protein EZV62_011976 [Acer yangbiense]
MALMMLSLCFLINFFLLMTSSVNACQRCVHQSKVAYFNSGSALSSGACGYGSLAPGFIGGHVAAGVPSLYNNGAGCGACFQVSLSLSLCSIWTIVVVTDLNHSNKTDFVLSSRAFTAMANNGKDQDILNLGIVDVEYKRVPCDYKNKNLAVRVEESSRKSEYLAIKILYQGGQTEIVGAEVAQVGSSSWNYMTRTYGAVWNTSRVPNGELQFRFVVTSGYDGKYVWAQHVLPANWKPGMIYDSGVQINDINIGQESCSDSECDKGRW